MDHRPVIVPTVLARCGSRIRPQSQSRRGHLRKGVEGEEEGQPCVKHEMGGCPKEKSKHTSRRENREGDRRGLPATMVSPAGLTG